MFLRLIFNRKSGRLPLFFSAFHAQKAQHSGTEKKHGGRLGDGSRCLEGVESVIRVVVAGGTINRCKNKCRYSRIAEWIVYFPGCRATCKMGIICQTVPCCCGGNGFAISHSPCGICFWIFCGQIIPICTVDLNSRDFIWIAIRALGKQKSQDKVVDMLWTIKCK